MRALVAITRGKSFDPKRYGALDDYIRRRRAGWRTRSCFHELHGAILERLVPGHRPMNAGLLEGGNAVRFGTRERLYTGLLPAVWQPIRRGGRGPVEENVSGRDQALPGNMPEPHKLENASMPELACVVRQVEHTLKGWFPSETFVKAASIDDYPILPEEQELVARAVDRRRHEFATGRWLSRAGLRHFGLPDRPIMMGRLRNPLWPESVTGTISHDGDLCAVVLGRKDAGLATGIGIDLVALSRPRAGKMDELASMFVAEPGELDGFATLKVAVDPALLLFSLKESVIKAMASRLDDFIDMRAIAIRYTGKFEVHVAEMLVLTELFAAVTGGYLITAASIR